MRSKFSSQAFGVLVALILGLPAKAGERPLDTKEIGMVLRAIGARCSTDLPKALDGAVKNLNALPSRAGAAPLAAGDQSISAFLAKYAAMDSSSVGEETSLRAAAIQGMVESLGPSARYIDLAPVAPRARGPARIYVSLQKIQTYTTIVSVVEGGPAQMADVRRGDQITSIDGQLTAGLAINDVTSLLQGEVNTSVQLIISRPGFKEKLSIDVQRKADLSFPRQQPVQSKVVSGVAIITVPAMDPGVSGFVKDAILALRRQHPPPVGYILDLRYNAGGRLDEVVALADLFMDEGVVGTVTHVDVCPSQEPQILRTRRGDETRGAPMIVLVNESTASGAELLAAGLAQSHRAKTMGQKTYGLGEIKTVFPTVGTMALSLLTGELLTADGKRLQGVGLVPSLQMDERYEPSDALLEAAIAVLSAS